MYSHIFLGGHSVENIANVGKALGLLTSAVKRLTMMLCVCLSLLSRG